MPPRGIVICGIAATLVGIRWIAFHSAGAAQTARGNPPIVAGAAYAVDVSYGRAAFDLKFTANQRYLLVLGSLGSAEEDYSVEIAAEPVDALERQNVLRLEPLRRRPPNRATAQPPLDRSGGSRNFAKRSPMLEVSHADKTPVPAFLRGNPQILWNSDHRDLERSADVVRNFSIHVTEDALEDVRGYRRVHARLLADGRHVRVYLDVDQRASDIHPGIADELARLFDEEILPVSRRHLGTHRDVDGDGKFTILLTHWLGKLQGGRTSVGGFVRNSDFLPAVGPPFGNRADVLYLNSNITPGPQLRTLLAHEYAHAVLFSARTRNAGRFGTSASEEDWLNEAIAHQAENLQCRNWSNLDYRISTFLNDPARCPLVVPDYYRAGRWRDHGCRGATYLFVRWCHDEFGPGLLRRLIQGPESGLKNLTRATGIPFADLFRHWSVALALPAKSPGGDEQERFRFLSLHGPIGRYGLAGARHDHWNVSDGLQLFSLHGTSVRVIEVAARHAPGFYRIALTAGRAAEMQVTLIKLPAEQPRLHVQAHWAAPANSAADDGDVLILETASDSTAVLRIEMVSCEAVDADPDSSVCLAPEEVETDLLRNGRKIKLPMPRRVRKQPAGEWIVKVLAVDSRGGRTSGWCTVRDEALLARQSTTRPDRRDR